ncbi:MAG TPA: hypothetical protein VKA04_10860 [Pseudodesulfovibrio sp.]|nr:hypothetical protein [Pseudodesulfovibrio sp.]
MLYFLGNCQMDFLSRAVAGLGLPVAHGELASPMTHASHPDGVPPALARLAEKHGLADAFNGRRPEDQFGLPGQEGEPPALLILNLFHETAPLFLHERDGFIFHMNPGHGAPTRNWPPGWKRTAEPSRPTRPPISPGSASFSDISATGSRTRRSCWPPV